MRFFRHDILTGITSSPPFRRAAQNARKHRDVFLKSLKRSRLSEELAEAQRVAFNALEDARIAHERLRDALECLPQGIVLLDDQGRYILWNQKYAEIYKGSADLFKVGIPLEQTLRIGVARGQYPEAIGREEQWLTERLERLVNPRERHEQTLADGRCILIEERKTSEGGNIGLRVDITEIKQREASFRMLFSANPVPMFVLAQDDLRVLAVNDTALDHYAYERLSVVGRSVLEFHAETADDEHSIAEMLSTSPQGLTWRHRKSDGTVIDVAVYARPLIHEGTPAYLLAALDITERKRAEAKIAYMAQYDQLTGLTNRLTMRQEIQTALARHDLSLRGAAVLCVNLDNFKAVNDSLGHTAGDGILKQASERLKQAVCESSITARLAGDDFAVLMRDIKSPDAASQTAKKIIEEIRTPFIIDGHEVILGASIGIAFAPTDGDTAEELMKNGDLALDRAKSSGRNRYHFFEQDLDARAQSRRQLEIDLRNAITNSEIDVYYQPLVDLETSAIKGFEALVRWKHPVRGFIPPVEFIPIAEETNLIAPLGAYVLNRACRDATQWPAHTRVAVNLSPLQFRLGNVLEVVETAIAGSGLSPSRLELEITESLLLEKTEDIRLTLHALRARGIRISLDDFGTGYSSLSYLRSFPFDKIKIDRSFVTDLGRDRESNAIVKAIITMGLGLGMTVTAEGIETESDRKALLAERCPEGQGFLFGKPQPQAATLALFARPAEIAI